MKIARKTFEGSKQYGNKGRSSYNDDAEKQLETNIGLAVCWTFQPTQLTAYIQRNKVALID